MRSKIVLVGIAVLFSVFCVAQNSDFKPVPKNEIQSYIAKMGKASASVTSLQCSFTQKKEIAVLSESVVSKGKLMYKKDSKLRWEYTTPYFYLFALNGDKVYLKNDKSTKQFDTKTNALFKEISVLLVNSISGTGMIDSKKFDAVFYENASKIKVKLTPKNKAIKSILNTIELYFDKSNYMVHSVEMTEATGDATSIIFTDEKLNQAIADEKFIIR